MSLYQKHRPQSFDRIIGQEHVLAVLENQLSEGRIAEAYLFAGPRGIGKTTLARILAKAVNCRAKTEELKGKTVPCGRCRTCLAIAEGRHPDVMEIDGASNRGIDEIRQLRSRIEIQPIEGGKRVYIIDEVHMLSKEAFNALLKTLEEPPSHVLFIFATTEVHRLPETVLSRVQRFDLRRSRAAEIVKNLKEIAEAEKIEAETEALELIAYLSDQSHRDAINLFEQSVEASKLTSKSLVSRLGLMTDQELSALFRMLADPMLAFEANKKLLEFESSGGDVPRLIDLLIRLQRDRLYSEFEKGEKRDPVLVLSGLSLLKNLIAAKQAQKTSPLPLLPLEMMIWQSQLGRVLPTEASPPVKQTARKKATGDLLIDQVLERWQDLIVKMRPKNQAISVILADCRPIKVQVIDQNSTVTIATNLPFYAERLLSLKIKRSIEKAMKELFGQTVLLEVKVVVLKGWTDQRESPLDEAARWNMAVELFEGEG